MSDAYIEKLKDLQKELEIGSSEIEAAEAKIQQQTSDINLYREAEALVPNVFKHYASTSKFEGLGPEIAPVLIHQLSFSHGGIVAAYRKLAETGKIGRNYLETVSSVINESWRKIGHVFGMYFKEIEDRLGGSKLFDELMETYGAFVV